MFSIIVYYRPESTPTLILFSETSKIPALIHKPTIPSGEVVERHHAVSFYPIRVYKATATPGPDELYKNIKQGEGQRLYVWAPVKGFEPTTSEEALVTG